MSTNSNANNGGANGNAWSSTEKPTGALANASTGKEPAKSVVGKVLAAVAPPRTTSAPPEMNSQKEKIKPAQGKSGKGKSGKSGGKQGGRRGSKGNKNFQGKGNFNANVQHFVPGPNMYNPQMYYPPQQQYPPQQGGGNYQPGNNNNRGGKRSGRSGRTAYHNNRNQQVQYPNGMNAQQVAAYQQQQMAYFHWQQQQHMMYAAQQQQMQQGQPRAGFNPNVGTFVPQHFVPPPQYQPNAPSWTPPNDSDRNITSNSNSATDTAVKSSEGNDAGVNTPAIRAPAKPEMRKRKPLEIKDKDGNIINGNIIKAAQRENKAKEFAEKKDLERPDDSREADGITEGMGNLKINGTDAKPVVVGNNGKYTIEELLSLRPKKAGASADTDSTSNSNSNTNDKQTDESQQTANKGKPSSGAFLVDFSFVVDNPASREGPIPRGRFDNFGGPRTSRYSSGRPLGGRGGIYSKTPSMSFEAANKGKLNSRNRRQQDQQASWARGKKIPDQAQDDAKAEERRRQQEQLADEFNKLREERRGDTQLWKKKEATDAAEKASLKSQGLLNKLTKDNFEKIFENFKKEIDMSAGVSVVRVVIDAIFDKALGEHFFTDIYADLCHRFAEKFSFFQQQFLKTKQVGGSWYWYAGPEGSPLMNKANQPVDNNDDPSNGFDSEEDARKAGAKNTHFKRVLLNKCQIEFQKGQLQIEVKKEIVALQNNTNMSSDEKAAKIHEAESRMKLIKKRAIGNVLFIGWLFRRSMLSEKIMHSCVVSLFQQEGEENLEALCKLFETIGKVLDKKGRKKDDTKKQMDIYFSNLKKMTGKDVKLPNRVKFMILDLIEMRNNQWVPRREKAQAKTKKEIHDEAKKEEQELLLRQAAHRKNSRNRPQGNDFRGAGRGGRGKNVHGRMQRGGRLGPSRPPPVQDLRPFNPRGSNANNNRLKQKSTTSMSKVNGDGTGQNRRPSNDMYSSNGKKNMSLEKLKKSLKSTIQEYLMIEDLNELKECINELPGDMDREVHFVTTCADIAINEKEINRKKIYKLMESVAKDKVVTADNIVNGFVPIFASLGDIMIDSPLAGKWIGELIGCCIKGGIDKGSVMERCVSNISNDKHKGKFQEGVDLMA